MIIKRDEYVNLLMQKRWNGKVKIITGIRRCGKSYLLNTLYKQRLLEEGVGEDCLVELALDKTSDSRFRNPNMLYEYVLSRTGDSGKKYYVMIDESNTNAAKSNTNFAKSNTTMTERPRNTAARLRKLPK